MPLNAAQLHTDSEK